MAAHGTRSARRRTNLALALVVALAAIGAVSLVWRQPESWSERDGPETVVLVILDAVRADHTSVCGYERPTTPTLDWMASIGATVTCRAYAPGDWSLPTHASFFTGLSVPEHGARYARQEEQSGVRGEGQLLIHPLRDDLPTLAETMGERGFQTLLVTANRLLGPSTGLSRGFHTVLLRPNDTPITESWVPTKLDDSLARSIGPERPLFLVINLVDAHDPWLAVPDTLEWQGLTRPAMPPYRISLMLDAYWFRFLPREKEDAMRSQLIDVYDYGIYRADAKLGSVVQVLERHGRMNRNLRMVVTADHGEMLARHGLVRHLFIYEGNVRIPFVYLAPAQPLALPEPLAAITVHHLLLERALPSSPTVPHVVSIPNPELKSPIERYHSDAAAIWTGGEKLVWMEGGFYLFDLDADRGEDHPIPLGDHPKRGLIEELAARVESSQSTSVPSEEMLEELRAMGYVSDSRVEHGK